MGAVRSLRFASFLVALSAGSAVAGAEPAPTKPRVILGTGSTSGGLFTASAGGAVFELPTRARIHVAAGASVRIFPVPQQLQLTPGPRTPTWSFALMNGRADIEMPSGNKSAVLVNMGKLSAIATKGRVACLAANDEATLDNIDGEVRTVVSDHWQTVALGEVATLSRDNPTAAAKPGLAFPVLSTGQRMFFASGDTVSMSGFGWGRVPGAERYEFRIRHLPDGHLIEDRTLARNEVDAGTLPVEPGKYGIVLRSVDARGLESRWSPEAELRVIGVVLPPGAYSTRGAIFLGAGQQVQFTNIDGLEMTYLGAGRYFPAAQAAGLYRNKTTVIGFRLPGTLDTATARLEPRDVYADVHIGPTRAVWPRDSVSIDIQLKSKDGGEVPAFLEVVPKVTLGTEPVELSFQREGSALHAVVPPSTRPGPWVLRVDVSDQFGVPLGHDFLEVAAQPRKKEPAVRIVSETKRDAAAPKGSTGSTVASAD